MSERAVKGIGAASGLAMGPVYRYQPQTGKVAVPTGTPEQELARFRDARERVAATLDQMAAQASAEAGAIVAAHRMMLDDPELHSMVESSINGGQSAAEGVHLATEQFAAMLEGLEDAYLRERAADVRDVGRRLIAALTGATVGLKLEQPCVVVAADLAPTDTIGVNREMLLGIVTEHGGPTSHTCILARSWGIPAVVGAAGALAHARTGMLVALDGTAGRVVFDPDAATQAQFSQGMTEEHARIAGDLAEAGLPGETPDGHRIELAGNAGSPDDVTMAMQRGAEAIGLMRSEFLFMGRDAAPDEDSQYNAYKQALQNADGRRVIIRTLDIGGDKHVPYLEMSAEENPFLGNRALRLCFDRPELFRSQLRALLRAGVHGRLAVMFPMVGSLDDLRRAKEALAEAARSLEADGTPYEAKPELGIMIEIPSAALIAPQLAREVDFFSLGTNDLVQYTLAVDRGNPELSDYYQPYHPALLRLVDMVVRAAHEAGKWVGVCGEMAGHRHGALLLLGLGIDELSMAAPRLPEIRRLVRRIPYADAKALAERALSLGTHAEVTELAGQKINS